MTLSREVLRRKAKKAYKENTKNIPKRKRIPFSQFFKQYKNIKNDNQSPNVEMPEPGSEDFDFENLINISEISDENLNLLESDAEIKK